MSLLGVQLHLMIGPTVPLPAPRVFSEALERVEVTHSDSRRSGFELRFRLGRGTPGGMIGDVLLASPLFKVFNRVILTAIFNGLPQVLLDGMVTHQQLRPADEPGAATLTLTGEDLSVMMDQEERSEQYFGDDMTIALQIIARYLPYGVIPLVVPPGLSMPYQPLEGPMTQTNTDLETLRRLAEINGYVFYIIPGPAPLTSMAYWGPPIRVGLPQPALNVNMGQHSNVESVNFQYQPLDASRVEGNVADERTGQTLPVFSLGSMRIPLASLPEALLNRQYLKVRRYRQAENDVVKAQARVQSESEKSLERVLTVSGELDTLRYGHMLQARALVGLRGAGFFYDGLYYVREVTHTLTPGSYRQHFTLAREGLGTTTPVVRP